MACAPLLPEHVLAVPGQVPVEQLQGGAGFGNVMAWVDGELAVAGDGAVHWRGERWPLQEVLALWAGPDGPRVATPDGVWDLVREQALYQGPVVAAHGEGEGFVVASDAGLIQDGQSRAITGVRRLWTRGAQVLLLRCTEAGCWVELDGEELGAAEEASALGFHEGEATWGVPAMGEEAAPGAIQGASGWRLEGLEGEHLGQSLCVDFGAGQHNLKPVPNQSRVRSLAGGVEVAVASGREGGPITLACDGDRLAVGQPTWLGGGRVWLLERPLGP